MAPRDQKYQSNFVEVGLDDLPGRWKELDLDPLVP